MSDGASNKPKASSAFHLLAGLGSGATSALLLQPADLLKTRIQQQSRPHLSSSSNGVGIGSVAGGGGQLTQALRTIFSEPYPVRTLWRGVTPSVIRTGCGSALYFGILNQLRLHYTAPAPSTTTGSSGSSSSSNGKLTNVANLSTGAAARVAAGIVVNPVTVLKVRYESTHFRYTSLLGAARDIVRTEGARGFFAGFGATAVRDAPYAGLYVVIYEACKTYLGAGIGGGGGSGVGVNFVSGVVAAVSATTMTNPFDAIKTRLQIAPGRYGNMVRAARMMVREEGVGSMFSGLSMRIGRKALSSAFTWTVYEELVRRAERVVVEV